MWRRELSGKLIAALAALGFIALVSFANADGGGIAVGVICVAGAALLFCLRRPATVTVGLAPVPGGTQLTVSGGPDAQRAADIVETVAGPPPLTSLGKH